MTEDELLEKFFYHQGLDEYGPFDECSEDNLKSLRSSFLFDAFCFNYHVKEVVYGIYSGVKGLFASISKFLNN